MDEKETEKEEEEREGEGVVSMLSSIENAFCSVGKGRKRGGQKTFWHSVAACVAAHGAHIVVLTQQKPDIS